MNLARSLYSYGPILLVIGLFVIISFLPDLVAARNINQYKDTISDSAPNRASNHTFSFQIKTDVGPGGYIEITPPAGFEVLGTSTFSAERNVELSVNGVARVVGPVLSATDDLVDIIPGTPGMIRYTFNQTDGLSVDDKLILKIGNHTSLANEFSEEYSSSTGTTTTIADIKPIVNGGTIGTQKVLMSIYDGGEVANAGFLIGLVNRVGVGPIDTTEEIPPFRFNGNPTSTVSGTTLAVEMSLETDELAICKFGTTPGIDFNSMGTRMTNTGMIFHTEVVSVVPDSVNTFYIRCIDDEGNYNIDDFIITFIVNPAPTGSSNEDGDVEGDGTGTGNNGSGSGGGGGGNSGSSDGQEPQTGGSSGSGGSGGGGGGGAGGNSGNSGGGGFETTDGPYRSGDGQVLITGYAPARSKVTAVVDGHLGGEATADATGAYSITITKIARGAYTFGVYATDGNKVKTSTISTSFTVAGARESALSNINIAPSLKVTPDPVTAGQPLTLSGTAMPNSTVTVENEREGSSVSRKSFTVLAGANGVWTIPVDTSSFGNGTYKARVKSVSTSPSVNTNFSDYVLYGVGQNADRPLSSDLNVDGKVNLVDFSILLFWWNSDGGNSNPPADINRDKKVNLTDFSILLFNWTG